MIRENMRGTTMDAHQKKVNVLRAQLQRGQTHRAQAACSVKHCQARFPAQKRKRAGVYAKARLKGGRRSRAAKAPRRGAERGPQTTEEAIGGAGHRDAGSTEVRKVLALRLAL